VRLPPASFGGGSSTCIPGKN